MRLKARSVELQERHPDLAPLEARDNGLTGPGPQRLTEAPVIDHASHRVAESHRIVRRYDEPVVAVLYDLVATIHVGHNGGKPHGRSLKYRVREALTVARKDEAIRHRQPGPDVVDEARSYDTGIPLEKLSGARLERNPGVLR
ncbi:MAG: hypothetical protein WCH13_10675, partial [Deltaproteobacteria bacterium]